MPTSGLYNLPLPRRLPEEMLKGMRSASRNFGTPVYECCGLYISLSFQKSDYCLCLNGLIGTVAREIIICHGAFLRKRDLQRANHCCLGLDWHNRIWTLCWKLGLRIFSYKNGIRFPQVHNLVVARFSSSSLESIRSSRDPVILKNSKVNTAVGYWIIGEDRN